MKKFWVFLSISLFCITAYSQSSGNTVPAQTGSTNAPISVPDEYKMAAVQSGTANIVNGKATIVLNKSIIDSLSEGDGKNTYFVDLTPIGNCGSLKLAEKGNQAFTVTTEISGSENAPFDYIVYLRYYVAPYAILKVHGK